MIPYINIPRLASLTLYIDRKDAKIFILQRSLAALRRGRCHYSLPKGFSAGQIYPKTTEFVHYSSDRQTILQISPI